MDDVAAEDVAAAADICPGDLVRVKSEGAAGPGFHGVVLLVPDADSHDPRLPAGTVRILLVDGTLKTAKAGDVTVVDRSYFTHGAVVVSPAGRIGIVTGVNTALDLVKLSDPAAEAMTGVSPDSLRRVRELSLGDFVVSGPWLGRVVEVSLTFNVVFDDGAVCRVIRDAQSKKLRPVATNNRFAYLQTNTWVYPGQRVTGPADIFKDCRWLNGYWRPSHTVGTVSKVEMARVLVYWIASAHHGTDRQYIQASAPPAYQHPNNLTFFCSALDCYWNIADRCFFRSRSDVDDDQRQPSVDYSNHKQEQSSSSSIARKKKLLCRIGQRRTLRRQAEFEQPMSVASTSTTVDVLWQDGTRQSGAPSTSLTHFNITTVHEFFPGHYVVDKAATGTIDEASTGQTRRVGVVRSMSFEDQTVGVSWFKQASSPDEGVEDDTVSAYDLAWLPDHFVSYGHVVVRLLPSGQGEPAATDLSWVGRVVDLHDGRVQVKWGDGNTSTVCTMYG